MLGPSFRNRIFRTTCLTGSCCPPDLTQTVDFNQGVDFDQRKSVKVVLEQGRAGALLTRPPPGQHSTELRDGKPFIKPRILENVVALKFKINTCCRNRLTVDSGVRSKCLQRNRTQPLRASFRAGTLYVGPTTPGDCHDWQVELVRSQGDRYLLCERIHRRPEARTAAKLTGGQKQRQGCNV